MSTMTVKDARGSYRSMSYNAAQTGDDVIVVKDAFGNWRAIPKTSPSNSNPTPTPTPSGTPVPVYINSDIINNQTEDDQRIDALCAAIEALGGEAHNLGSGVNTYTAVGETPDGDMLVQIVGGVDAGWINDMHSAYFKGVLSKRKMYIVLVPGQTLTYYGDYVDNTFYCDWLPRAHDDDYDSADFTGLAYPYKVIASDGYGLFEDFVYTDDTILANAAKAIYNASCYGTDTQAILDSIGAEEAKYADVQNVCSDQYCFVNLGYGDCWADASWLYDQLEAAEIKARIMGYVGGGSGEWYRHTWVRYYNGSSWVDWPYTSYGSQHHGDGLGAPSYVLIDTGHSPANILSTGY